MDDATQAITLVEGRELARLGPETEAAPPAVSSGAEAWHSGASDAERIAIWLNAKASAGTRRVYAEALRKLHATCAKPPPVRTVSDLFNYEERLLVGDGQGRRPQAASNDSTVRR